MKKNNFKKINHVHFPYISPEGFRKKREKLVLSENLKEILAGLEKKFNKILKVRY